MQAMVEMSRDNTTFSYLSTPLDPCEVPASLVI
jgi:hypothetical protein